MQAANLPAEIVQRSMISLPSDKLLQLCQKSRALAVLVDSPAVWCKKVLIVQTNRELGLVLEQREMLRYVKHLDISGSPFEECEVRQLIACFDALESIRLCNLETQILDETVLHIVRRHGASLTSIHLDRSYQLTNVSIEAICQHCPRLQSLSLYACMFSNAALHLLAQSDIAKRLRQLNLGRCHLLEFMEIKKPIQSFKALHILVLSHNDSVMPKHLVDVVKRLRRLKRVDVTDCAEICGVDVGMLREVRQRLDIVHSSRLDDFSPSSIRAYLLSLEGLLGPNKGTSLLSWRGDPMDTDGPSDLEVSELLTLLYQKQQPDCPLSLQQAIYQRTCLLFKKYPKCIWCRMTPLAMEMLHLFALPPNALTEAFERISDECLRTCSSCISAYHVKRREFLEGLRDIFEDVEAFEQILFQRDVKRLYGVLAEYLAGSLAASDGKLLYGLFEILGFPLCLQVPQLSETLCKVMHQLIGAKKMLKVTRVMPGVVLLAFSKDQAIRGWALSVLSGKLDVPSEWHPELVGLPKAVESARLYLDDDGLLKSVCHVLHWVPAEALAIENGWLQPFLSSIDLERANSLLLLCVALDRLARTPKVGLLGLNNIYDFVARLLKLPSLFTLLSRLAVFPAVQPAGSVLHYSYPVCVTQWLRSLCSLACALKDGRLLDLIVASLVEGMDKVTTSDARNNLISLLINIVQHCTTSQDLLKETFCIPAVRSSLDFLARYFLKCSHPHKPNPLLLETSKTCIQFDCNQLEQNLAEGSFDPELISRLLIQFSEDRTVFELLRGLCVRLFVSSSDDRVFSLALSTRMAYLSYISRSWPLLGSADCEDPAHVLLLLTAHTFSEAELPQDFLRSFFVDNLAAVITGMASWLKKVKLVPELHEPVLKMAKMIEKNFLPFALPRSGPSPLDALPSPVFLKLHLISLIASLLSTLTLGKESSAFYAMCESLSLTIEALGMDALKQCLRENAGMAKRFRHLVSWSAFFAKHSAALEPGRAKALAAFQRDMLRLAVCTDTRIGGMDKQMAVYLATFQMDGATSALLKPATLAYEKHFGVVLGLKFYEPVGKRPSIDLTIPNANIEERFLQRLKAEADKALPTRLLAAPPAPRLTTKLGQLKQEISRELAVKAQPVKKRNTNAAVHHTAKAAKLDVHQRGEDHASSDHDDVIDFTNGLKDDLSALRNTGGAARDTSGRSVKLIAIEDLTNDLEGRGRKQADEDYVAVDPQAPVKRLFKYLLDLDLDKLDDRNFELSVEGAGAIKQIPDRFESTAEYVQIFEPLLLFECRSQLVQAKLDLDSAACFSAKVLAISAVDEYHEVTIGVETEENSRLLCEHDYIMARLDAREAKSEIVGVVIQSSVKGSRMTEACVRFKFKPHQQQYQVELRIGLVWKVKKLCNWVTNIREFNALHSMHDLRLSKAILNPSCAPVDPAGLSSASQQLESVLDVNPSQAQAIALALNNPNAFTLIQGPPGTGKTRTILGLVGALFGRPYPGLVSKLRPQRLLICAPSNAAIDEIVRRLKEGVYDCYHQRFVPKILRLGSHDMIHEDVQDLTLDATMERIFGQSCKDSVALLAQQKAAIAGIRAELDAAERTGSHRPEDLQRLRQDLWQARDVMKKNNGFIESTRQGLRNKVVAEAQIVCSTLSASGMDLLARLQFDVVIIDEACQAVEVSALIPLQYGCKNCILVGDPNQLPPTVISQAASIFSYEQSLFQRIQKASPTSVHLLSMQYRMHPAISAFPNRYFYSGRLTDGPQMADASSRPWHGDPMLRPYLFFDIPGQERNQVRRSGAQGTSKSNEMEARACASLLAYLCSQSPEINFAGKIGVVTPYKDQRRTLKREFRKRFGDSALSSIEISTVDGYQGQEKEIIIFSCVRTCETGGIGFLTDARRLNVALTRAKASLFILGRAEALSRNGLWRELIKDARERSCFVRWDPKFWDAARGARAYNLIAPNNKNGGSPSAATAHDHKAKSKEKILPAVDASSFKIKTPMQRRREAVEGQQTASTAVSSSAGPSKSKPLLLDSLLEKLESKKP